MSRRPFAILLSLIVIALVACGGQSATPSPAGEVDSTITSAPSASDTPLAETEPTATVAASPTPAQAEGATAAPETPTLPPIRATQQALADSVTLSAPTRVQIAPDDYVAITDQACGIVQENYVRDDFNGVDWQAVCEEYEERAAEIESRDDFQAMMRSFIAELGDDHSRYVPPGGFASEFGLPDRGAGQPWPGFTVWPAREDERLLIWNVCEVGPAAAAGLQRGDVITAIDGQAVEGDPAQVPVNELLYAPGKDEVTLTVLQGPDSAPRDVTIDYGGASGCDGWQYGLLAQDPRVGYIRVPDFGGDAASNIMDMIQAMEEEAPLDGLIVDVRHNPGGNADEAIAIFTTGEFGMTGPLREDATQSIYRIRGPVRWNDTTPMALLTDGASHSAAEYFAVAMKLSGRATLVGMPTAGNTEGITGFNLADGSIVRLAVMTLQLPDGSTLEGVGVQPDVRVPLGDWGLRQSPDVQLQAAREVVMEQIQ